MCKAIDTKRAHSGTNKTLKPTEKMTITLEQLPLELSQQYEQLNSKNLSSLSKELNVQIDKAAIQVIVNLQRTQLSFADCETVFIGKAFIDNVSVSYASESKKLKQIILKHFLKQNEKVFNRITINGQNFWLT